MYKLRWVTSAAALACAGALVACADDSGPTGDVAPSTGAPSAAATSAASTTPPQSAAAPETPGTATTGVLSGRREVAIVRVQATESALSVVDGELVEVDDDSGRHLFVPTPLGGDRYQIKAYLTPDNHPASDEPVCWQVHNPGTTASLTVDGAPCDAKKPAQGFTIRARGQGQYAISYQSAFLQYSPRNGLILEELGDAPLVSTFRFVDNGPARRPAGG